MATALLLLTLVAPGDWQTYEVYQPRVERFFVNNCLDQALKYNHDSAIAWFGDRWFCLWNANDPPVEGRPGQLNYQSTSRDGKVWSPPVACFSDAAACANPVPCPKGTQWQPNLIVVGGELWAVWCQNSRDEHNGAYVSKLRDPAGRWTNQRLVWDGDPGALLEGQRWRIFPTQNPVRLRSGRVLAPVTLQGAPAKDAPADVTGWWATEKRNSVLFTDDGQTWQCSPGAAQPGRSWAQWEPTVWQAPDGRVLMVARNNDARTAVEGGPPPSQMLLASESRDGGATWTPHRYVPLETVASRMHVLPLEGDRHVMVHNDWATGRFVNDRLNLALFFTRGPGVDFAPGLGLTGAEPVVCYPQMWVHDGRLLISYSQGHTYRSIKVAHVSPLPDQSRHYLLPRSNLPAPPTPTVEAGALHFAGGQWLRTKTPVDPGPGAYTVAGWLRSDQGGTVLDTRSGPAKVGFLFALSGLQPLLFCHTPERNISPRLEVVAGAWCYVAVSADPASREVLFRVNDREEVVQLQAPPPALSAAPAAAVGFKGFASSAVQGFHGALRALWVCRGRLSAAEHAVLHNRHAAALGRPLLPGPSTPPDAAWTLEATTDWRQTCEVPEGPAESVEVATGERGAELVFRGEASAGVELPANERAAGDAVELELSTRAEGDTVVATVGDAVAPARLWVRRGQASLEAGEQKLALGRVDGWFDVRLRTAGEQTTATVNGRSAAVRHAPSATWAFLGQGYRRGDALGTCRVAIASVRSRVVPAQR